MEGWDALLGAQEKMDGKGREKMDRELWNGGAVREERMERNIESKESENTNRQTHRK